MYADRVIVWQTLKVAIIDLAGYFSVEYKFHVQFSRTNMKGSKPFHFICNQNKFKLPLDKAQIVPSPPSPPLPLHSTRFDDGCGFLAGQFIVSQPTQLSSTDWNEL